MKGELGAGLANILAEVDNLCSNLTYIQEE